jgi:hypothetical protein
MSQTVNQMLALIDRVIKGDEPTPTATQALQVEQLFEEIDRECAAGIYLTDGATDEELEELDADLLEACRDQRARDWLASLRATA